MLLSAPPLPLPSLLFSPPLRCASFSSPSLPSLSCSFPSLPLPPSSSPLLLPLSFLSALSFLLAFFRVSPFSLCSFSSLLFSLSPLSPSLFLLPSPLSLSFSLISLSLSSPHFFPPVLFRLGYVASNASSVNSVSGRLGAEGRSSLRSSLPPASAFRAVPQISPELEFCAAFESGSARAKSPPPIGSR